MNILIQQPRVPHYRIPLFQRIVETHRWHLTVVYTPSEKSGESGLECANLSRVASRLRLEALPIRVLRIGSLQWKYQVGLLQQVRQRHWDGIFIEGAQANLSGFLAALWCRRRRIPCIWWGKGYFGSQPFYRRWINRLQLKIPDAFLPYGDTTHQFLVEHGVNPARIVSAYNTVDIESLVSRHKSLAEWGHSLIQQIGWHEHRPLVISVGRIIPAKRVHDVCQAIATLNKRGMKLFLLVVGDGPDRSRCEAIVQELGIGQQVHFTGRVPEDVDSALLTTADVAVFCGALGLAINQAMALKIPVVVADLPGPDGEMIEHLRTGWRYPYKDVSQLSETLVQVLTASNREEILSNAYHEITTKRNLQSYANAFAQALQVAQRR